MSDEWGGQEGGALAAAAPQGPSAGMLLRQAREASGLHVAALAVSLKVPVRKLEALEDDRYDLMTDSVFIRGLAASVCRTLKIDPQPILDRLPQRAAPRLVRDDDGINTPFRAPSDGPPARWVEQLTRPVYLAVFALLLGALVLVLLPATQREEAAKGVSRSEVLPAASVSTPAFPPPSAAIIPVQAEPGPTLVAEASLQPAPVPAQAPAPAAVAAPMPAAAVAAATPAPNSSTAIFVIHATGASWVEVTDAKGAVPLRKMLAPGDTEGVSGPLPLRVIVGRSDRTEVLVRGKPFDVKAHARADNLARFEVK